MIFKELKRAAQNVNSVVVYVDGERPLFVFIPQLNRNLYFDETILESLSMSEKSLKILLNMPTLLVGLYEVSRQF